MGGCWWGLTTKRRRKKKKWRRKGNREEEGEEKRARIWMSAMESILRVHSSSNGFHCGGQTTQRSTTGQRHNG